MKEMMSWRRTWVPMGLFGAAIVSLFFERSAETPLQATLFISLFVVCLLGTILVQGAGFFFGWMVWIVGMVPMIGFVFKVSVMTYPHPEWWSLGASIALMFLWSGAVYAAHRISLRRS